MYKLPQKNICKFKKKGINVNILNLYSGIGGNRKLWGDEHNIVAVEFNPEIAAIYQEYFPNDTVMVADAHEYLLQHYKEFDFIWSSPPCQTHSKLRIAQKNTKGFIPKYPSLNLWQEIIFLKHHAVCPYVIENVIPYYDVFLEPTLRMDRHLFWSNVKLKNIDTLAESDVKNVAKLNTSHTHFGFSGKELRERKTGGTDKQQILANLVNPEIGLAILDQVRGIKRKSKLKQISILEEL